MFDTVAQLLINGLMTGVLIAIPAIGFTTIYAVLRYPNFAIAAYVTIGAFAGWVVNFHLGGGIVGALLAAMVVSGIIGLVCEQVALSSLRPIGALTVAIGSIALNLVLESGVRFFFGNDLRGYDLPISQDWMVAGLRIGPQQIENMFLALAIMAGFFLFLRFTRFGKAMRAVADNSDLAQLKGIDPVRIAMITVFLGAGLAGTGGVLIGLDTSIDPLTGARVLLSIFAAAVLGGLGSIPGAVVGALLIGVSEELSLLFFPPTYKTAIGFFAILLMLTFRPRGLLGERAV